MPQSAAHIPPKQMTHSLDPKTPAEWDALRAQGHSRRHCESPHYRRRYRKKIDAVLALAGEMSGKIGNR